MKQYRSGTLLILFIIATILWNGCKSTEAPVTVIEGNPKAASADTTVATEANEDSEFMELTIGELHPLQSMDPLFATNTSMKRLVQQVYEGLVRYDAQGNVVPAIAADWTVSDDSLTYRFSLRKNVYYHDSDIFAAGSGQRVTSADFRYVFKRMARMNVPPHAAKLFMSVEGFEPYYREQRQLYNPEDRKLSEISGIRTPRDTTLIFKLHEKDPRFLRKLAAPYAVTYPRQAVRKTPDDSKITRAVGSGPFQLSQYRNDSTLTLGRFEGYRKNRDSRQMTPRLNRIDILHRSEQILYEQFRRDEIDLIPELGPHTLRQVVDSTGQLTEEASEQGYILYPGGSFTYRFYHNPQSPLSRETVQRTIDVIDIQNIGASIHPPITQGIRRSPEIRTDAASKPASSLQVVYSDDPFIRQFVQLMNRASERPSIEIHTSRLRVATDATALIADRQVPLYPHLSDTLSAPPLFKFEVQHMALSQSGIEQYEVNRYPWWLNLLKVRVARPDQSL